MYPTPSDVWISIFSKKDTSQSHHETIPPSNIPHHFDGKTDLKSAISKVSSSSWVAQIAGFMENLWDDGMDGMVG